jgi:hypothetical protein
VLDDCTVVGQSRFFGGVVDTQPKGFAINFDLCSKLLPFPVHTSVPSGVSRIQSSFRVTHRVFRSSSVFERGSRSSGVPTTTWLLIVAVVAVVAVVY